MTRIVVVAGGTTVLVHSDGSTAAAGPRGAHGRCATARSSLVVNAEPLLLLVGLALLGAHAMLGSRASSRSSGNTSRDGRHGEGSGRLRHAGTAAGETARRSGRRTARDVLGAVRWVAAFRSSRLRVWVLRHLGRVLGSRGDAWRVERLDLRTIVGEIDRCVVLRTARVKLHVGSAKAYVCAEWEASAYHVVVKVGVQIPPLSSAKQEPNQCKDGK